MNYKTIQVMVIIAILYVSTNINSMDDTWNQKLTEFNAQIEELRNQFNQQLEQENETLKQEMQKYTLTIQENDQFKINAQLAELEGNTSQRKQKLAQQMAELTEKQHALKLAREREQKKIEDICKKQQEENNAFLTEARTVLLLDDPQEALKQLKNIKKDHNR